MKKIFLFLALLPAAFADARPLPEIESELKRTIAAEQKNCEAAIREALAAITPPELVAEKENAEKRREELSKKLSGLYKTESAEQRSEIEALTKQLQTVSSEINSIDCQISMAQKQKLPALPSELNERRETIGELNAYIMHYRDYSGANRFINYLNKDERAMQYISPEIAALLKEYKSTYDAELKEKKEIEEKYIREQTERIAGILLKAKEPEELDALIEEFNPNRLDFKINGTPMQDVRRFYEKIFNIICIFQNYINEKNQRRNPEALQQLERLDYQNPGFIFKPSELLRLKNGLKNAPPPPETKIIGVYEKLSLTELRQKLRESIKNASTLPEFREMSALLAEERRRPYESRAIIESPLAGHNERDLIISFINSVESRWQEAETGKRVSYAFSLKQYYNNGEFPCEILRNIIGRNWEENYLRAGIGAWFTHKPKPGESCDVFIRREFAEAVAGKDWTRLSETEAFFGELGKRADDFYNLNRPTGLARLMEAYRFELAGFYPEAVLKYKKTLELEGTLPLVPLISEQIGKIQKEHPKDFPAAGTKK